MILQNLENLDAKNNKLESFSGVTNFESLTELSLSNNKITDIFSNSLLSEFENMLFAL